MFVLKYGIVFMLMVSSMLCWAQTKVELTPEICTINIENKSMFQALNDHLNIGLNICNGYNLQITSLPLKLINCKATINYKNYKLILINNIDNITYISKPCKRNKLNISCLDNGDLQIYIKGLVFNKNKKVKVNATIIGAIPHSEFIKPIIHE